ncbi:MAG TPA: hypothetical protein VD788_00275 [Candidatus Polarisedimenticolaceae bacterium]|nr:hypothetical protein [Candidatus Polarisedimenticolaceae bacterium]
MNAISKLTLVLILILAWVGPTRAEHTSTRFAGAKVNSGTVSHAVIDGADVLTLSDDFVVPDAPAPHWQVVDSRGNVYLLQRLVVKGDVEHRSINLPAQIDDVARVQIWCAWAEALLGEAVFEPAIERSRR